MVPLHACDTYVYIYIYIYIYIYACVHTYPCISIDLNYYFGRYFVTYKITFLLFRLQASLSLLAWGGNRSQLQARIPGKLYLTFYRNMSFSDRVD
jgi:hypothetical protein